MNGLLNIFVDHLIILPIVLPLAAGSIMLLFDGRTRMVKAAVSLAATAGLVAVAIRLLRLASSSGAADGQPFVYLLGNWPAPFGIVLVLDQLSAIMVMLSSILALASLVYSLTRWDRAGVHFHPLFQFLLMGLNGAFLTGDLFNLFVFFEVLLAASYGLLLHGSGPARVKTGMHYIAVNLATSSLFLIGASLLYGITGTLNMADLAVRIPDVVGADRILIETGAAILGVAFLVKAGMWPLGFWLVPAYRAATPPAAAIFAIMTKVGIYILLRLSLLVFGDGAGESAAFGRDWLFYGGLMTIIFGMTGVLAAQDSRSLAGFSLLVSSGTLLAAVGINQIGVTAGALFYLVSSTLAISALYLLVELMERGREFGADMLAVTREAYGAEAELDPDEAGDEEVGVAIPATMAILGISFVCCATIIAGLPPLSGFLAKFALLSGLFQAPATVSADAPLLSAEHWIFVAVLILSGLAALIALIRAGTRAFWGDVDREVPRVSVVEMAPIAVLLVLCLTLTLRAGPVMTYMESTARALHDPLSYVRAVVVAEPRPASTDGETAP